MSKKGRLILLIVCIGLAIVMSVTATIVVLVARVSTVGSNVNIEYKTTDNVNVRASAQYRYGNTTSSMTSGGLASGGTSIVISASNKTASLSPTAKISFNSSASRVVFRYTFTNLMTSADVGIELAENRTTTNTTTRYAYSDTAISDYTLFDDTSITYGEYTKQVISGTTAGNSTKYIYIIVDITNTMRDATYTNTVTWTLTREEGVTLTFDTSSADKVVDGNNTTITLANFSGSNATTNILAGTTMSNTSRVIKNGKAIDPIFYPLKDNKMFIGWTTDSANAIDNPSCVVDLSSTTFAEDTTLHPAFMTGTIPTSAYSLYNGSYRISIEEVYVVNPETGETITSPSTTIQANTVDTNGNFVIPDIYNGHFVTSDNYEYNVLYNTEDGATIQTSFDGLLKSGGATNVFVGNYFADLLYVFQSDSSLRGDNIQNLVSKADNIVIGRAVFGFSPSISTGDSVVNGWNLLSAPITTIRVMPGNGVYDSRENCNCVIETATNKVVKTSNNSVIPNSVKSSNVIQLMNRTAYPATTTKNGVTFTNNGDGTITLSGTSTASGYLSIMQYPEANNGHTLLLTGCPAGGTSSTYYISLANQGAGTQDYGNGVIKKTDSSKMRYISIVFGNNVTFNNVTFTPQLFDLTVMYGEGKEPTTVAEFRSKYSYSYYEYNTDTNGYIDWKNMSGNTTITSINIPEGVTEIPANAFKGCTALTNVVFPSTIVSIGNNAFDGCSALTSVTLPSSLQTVGEQAFSNCTALTTVTFTKGAKLEIGAKAFFGCSVLATVNMPSTIYSIGDQAFNGNYASVVYNKAMPCSDASGKYWFHKAGSSTTNTANIANWDNVVAIAVSAFDSITNLTTASIPSGVKYIGAKTFANCTNLANLTCNGKVEYVGDSAFQGCSKITNFDASNASYIGTYAFYNCTSLVSVTTGNKLTYIGPSAFRACTSLTSFIIPDSVTEIKDYTFYTSSSLANVTMSKNLVKIGASAFYRTALTEVTIPEGVTSIGNYAFYDLQNLATLNFNAISLAGFSSSSQVFYQAGKTASNGGFVLNIGSKVKRIPDYMFYVTAATTYAPYISAVNIPQDNVLTEFGKYSFAYVQGSFSININHDISTIDNYTFANSKIKDFIIQGNITKFGIRVVESTSNMDNFIVYGDVYQIITTNAFKNSAVKTIKFLGSITSTSATYKKIGNYFAQDCTQLTTVILPSSVTLIGGSAFSGCTSLTSIVLPDSIATISRYAFASCTSLQSIRLPNGLTSIEHYSFNNCSSLATINNYTSRITAIYDYAFYGTALTSFDTLDGVTTIGLYAFGNCSKLKTLRIGSAVKKIGTNVLTGTTNVSVTMAVTSGWVAATSSTVTTGTALTFGADGSANYTVFMNNKTSYINRP